MALALISILTLATTAIAAPFPQTHPHLGCKYTYYTYPGDTCSSIAFFSICTEADIFAANPFLDCNNIRQYTPVCIPIIPSSQPPSPTPSCRLNYNSVVGDTCASIATRFDVTSDDILSANSFLNCNDIWAGTNICVPETTTQPSPTTPVTPVPSCASTYTVSHGGETCDSIGAQFGVSGAQIKTSNDFLNCQDIWIDTSICIPAPTKTDSGPKPAPTCALTFKTVAGETCYSIARQYGISESDVLTANPFLDCNDIWSGTQICVPAVDEAKRPSPEPTCLFNYTSVAGDTCESIGTMFDATAADILAANTFLDCNDIWENTPICIAAGPSP